MKIIICALFLPAISFANTIQISSNTSVATAGYYQLSWNLPDNETVIVQESNTNNFLESKEIYRGKDSSTAISGKKNGDYYYRAKTGTSDLWGSDIKVTVAHHSLSKAFIFFFFGLIVFSATCIVIIRNHKKYQ